MIMGMFLVIEHKQKKKKKKKKKIQVLSNLR